MATHIQTRQTPDWVRQLKEKGFHIREATQSTGLPAPKNRRPAHALKAFLRRAMRRIRNASVS